MYPLTFAPLFKERVWGGRTLETLYGKALPPDVPIGESWEVSDRPGDESVITSGAFAGRTLRWIMANHGGEVLGTARAADGGRFPLLCKLLDAREKLSLQVHPPAHAAASLGGDPKTEMWYVADATPDAELFVGIKRGMTRADFEDRLGRGTVAECFHRIPVRAGDTMFLPSGRVHAIGAGLVIFEIQQNSDTTYRVFDWNRLGLDGRPRDLHIDQSLASIDFDDIEPALATSEPAQRGTFTARELVRHELFNADLWQADVAGSVALGEPRLRVVAAVERDIVVRGGGVSAILRPGEFSVLPAALTSNDISGEAGSRFLVVEPG